MTSSGALIAGVASASGRAATAVEAVEDEGEAPGELDGVVVSGLGELRRDLDERWVIVARSDRLRSSLYCPSGVAGRLEPERLLLKREAVDIGVLHRVGVDRGLERESRFAETAHYRVVVLQV